MSDIYIMLVDTSGSMGSPFSQTSGYPGVTEEGEYHTKIEAVKGTLLKQIRSLRGSEVAVIGFNSLPYLVHRGFARNVEQFENRIQALQAMGETNIAAALLYALQLEDIQSYSVVSFIVLTDGLDDVDRAERAAIECRNTLPNLIRIDTILISHTAEGMKTAESITFLGMIHVVNSSITLDPAVSQASEEHTAAAVAAASIPNFNDLRSWWHDILRSNDRYVCYALFLWLPSDSEVIRYLTDFGKELDQISGRACLVLALSDTEFRRSGFDRNLWEYAINDQTEQGYSLEIARRYGIKLTEFPCVLLFEDIRSNKFETFSLKGRTTEEIASDMRAIFTVVQDAARGKDKPLAKLRQHKSHNNIKRINRTIWSRLTIFTEKTFSSAVEAWLKTIIK